MTNADVIRNMSDDELYKFLQAIETGDIDYSLTFCSLCKDTPLDCDECFKRWLFGDADDYNGLLADKSINSGYVDHKTENSSEIPNNSTISKMEQVEDETRTDDAYFLELMGAVERGEISDAGANQAWYEYINHKDEPQTETEIAKAIVHKMIDDAVIAEDAYPDLRQKMHDAVDEYEPQTDCAWR